MQGPGEPNEKAIKKLLVSRKWKDRRTGLEQLDEEYRPPISGRLRRWSDDNGLGLTACDIKDAWRDTVKEMTRKVKRRKFKRKGRLGALLNKIARRRAIDILRRRKIAIEAGVEPTTLTVESSHSLSELFEELELCYDKMSEKLSMVVRIDVLLSHRSNGKPVSLDELTEEVNRRHGLNLPKTTVKSRRERGTKELVRLLQQRRYGE